MPQMQQLAAAQSSPEVPVNENFETLEHQAVYGRRHAVTTGLTWGYYGGRWSGVSIADGTLTLAGSATNRVVVHRGTGAISVSSTSTNWDNVSLYARVYEITTSSSVVTAVQDYRAGVFGVHGHLPGVRTVNAQSGAYNIVASDAFTTILHPSADTSARTFTIPADASIAYREGTELHFVNQDSAGVLTISITSDVLRLAGAGTTGNRTLAANGVAIARKVTASEWIISGTGLT
jgi:hypothetical protein